MKNKKKTNPVEEVEFNLLPTALATLLVIKDCNILNLSNAKHSLKYLLFGESVK